MDQRLKVEGWGAPAKLISFDFDWVRGAEIVTLFGTGDLDRTDHTLIFDPQHDKLILFWKFVI